MGIKDKRPAQEHPNTYRVAHVHNAACAARSRFNGKPSYEQEPTFEGWCGENQRITVAEVDALLHRPAL